MGHGEFLRIKTYRHRRDRTFVYWPVSAGVIVMLSRPFGIQKKTSSDVYRALEGRSRPRYNASQGQG